MKNIVRVLENSPWFVHNRQLVIFVQHLQAAHTYTSS